MQDVCQLRALLEDQQLLLPSWMSSTVSESMCLIPFTKLNENETIHDNDNEGGSREDWGARENGTNLFYENVMGMIYLSNTDD